MKFKRIYIEITNSCNLNCSFCSKSFRDKRNMSILEFETVLKKIDKYTDFIYLHVKGEPLLHPDLDKILELLDNYNKKVVVFFTTFSFFSILLFALCLFYRTLLVFAKFCYM